MRTSDVLLLVSIRPLKGIDKVKIRNLLQDIRLNKKIKIQFS